MSEPLTIVRTQALNLQAGKWEPSEKIFVQVYAELATSGLLADLHGNELKILLALALHARPLERGPADEGSSVSVVEEFRRKGLLGPQDEGRLYCSLSHEALKQLTGLAENTVTKYAQTLIRRGLIEKRTVWRGSRVRNLYFILPTTHIDKFNTYHRRHSTPTTAANLATVTVATPEEIATNHRRSRDVEVVVPAGETLDAPAVLAHFAARKGVTAYRPTVHDRKRLAELQEKGYSQAEVIAAIDQAFDERPADAPPIRQFSYCARIALSRPPQAAVTTTAAGTKTPTAGSGDDPFRTEAPATPPGDPVTPGSSPPPPASPQARSTYERVLCWHEQEIGPLTPLVRAELERLVQHYPDLEPWQQAFRAAALANVRRLDYVVGVLKNRDKAAIKNEGRNRHEQRKPNAKPHRRRRQQAARRATGWTDKELAAAQERGQAAQPLDVEAVLGTRDA
jgi:hypothetical protein